MLNTYSKPILTIAIPTYNREVYLDLCLKRIYEEVALLRDESQGLVRVFISDNHSLDSTQNIVAKYKQLMPDIIESMRNEENVGPDNNIVQCYSVPTTPYVWVFGDDDVILEGGLQQVLDALVKEDIDLLFVNSYPFENDYLEKKHPVKHSPLVYLDASAFAKRTNILLTFISTTIMRSGAGAQFIAPLKGTSLIQLSWVMSLLNNGDKFGVIENFLVAAKAGNSGGYSLVEVFGKNLDAICKRILTERTAISKMVQNSAIVYFFPFYILESKKGIDNFTKGNMRKGLSEVFRGNWRYYIFILPMLEMPQGMAKIYFSFLRFIRKTSKTFLI